MSTNHSFFKPKRSAPTEVGIDALPPVPGTKAGSGAKLRRHFREHLGNISERSIIAHWSTHERPELMVKRCPQAVAEAFFMHPCDEAVVFFERYFFPIEKFESDLDPDVVRFVSACRSYALADLVRDSVETFGAQDTLARIADGLSEDESLSTGVLRLRAGLNHA